VNGDWQAAVRAPFDAAPGVRLDEVALGHCLGRLVGVRPGVQLEDSAAGADRLRALAHLGLLQDCVMKFVND